MFSLIPVTARDSLEIQDDIMMAANDLVLSGSIRFFRTINWYQSLVALDLGFTRFHRKIKVGVVHVSAAGNKNEPEKVEVGDDNVESYHSSLSIKVLSGGIKATTATTTPSTILRAKSIAFRKPTTRTTPTPVTSNIKDKGKAKMIEPEVPLKKKDQLRLDEELARKLEAEELEAIRLEREKAQQVKEANISWDNV
ncbi:hypothetical protein Tco_1000048 [Tanacetum coccineum]